MQARQLGQKSGHMLVSHEREKLINAIIYFAQHTKHLGKIKLFKLLYLLDFEHYRSTGRSVTGLKYHAWPLGPVPLSLAQEWEELQPDMAACVSIQPEKIIDYYRETVVANAPFDDSHFSKREMRIMADIAGRYRDELSYKMIDVTHAENGAWATVWQDGAGRDKPIDYTLAIADDAPNREAILEAAKEYEAVAQSARC